MKVVVGSRAMNSRRVYLKDLNAHLLCVLCGGYFVEATTIIECVHSFCRSCIVKHLQSSRYCPICEVMVHKTRPLVNIRPDHILQAIVNKLVPGLWHRELKNKLKFYDDRPHYTKPEDLQSIPSLPDDTADTISVSLTLAEGSGSRWYLRCPSAVNVVQLKKLVMCKYGLDSRHVVIDILLNAQSLHPDLTLLQLSYLQPFSSPHQIECLDLTYVILGIASERKLEALSNGTVEPAKEAAVDKEIQLEITEGGVMSMSFSCAESLHEIIASSHSSATAPATATEDQLVASADSCSQSPAIPHNDQQPMESTGTPNNGNHQSVMTAANTSNNDCQQSPLESTDTPNKGCQQSLMRSTGTPNKGRQQSPMRSTGTPNNSFQQSPASTNTSNNGCHQSPVVSVASNNDGCHQSPVVSAASDNCHHLAVVDSYQSPVVKADLHVNARNQSPVVPFTPPLLSREQTSVVPSMPSNPHVNSGHQSPVPAKPVESLINGHDRPSLALPLSSIPATSHTSEPNYVKFDCPTYSSIRLWSPSKQRLRPRLMSKTDTGKMRTVPRFLGNPASGVKPMYSNGDVTATTPAPQQILRIDPKTLRPYVKETKKISVPPAAPLITSPFVPRDKPLILPDPLTSPYNPMSFPPGMHSSLPPTISLPYRNLKMPRDREES